MEHYSRFQGKFIFLPQNMEKRIIFYKKIKTKLNLLTITERGQRINRTTEHLENYLLVY